MWAKNIIYPSGEWGTFGDYVGGLLTPILSYCAFIVLLWTIHIQIESNRISKKTVEKQWRYIERKEKKEEWRSVIDHTEKQIEKQLGSPAHKNGVIVCDRAGALVGVGHEVHKSGKSGDKEFADKLFKKHFDDVDVDHFLPLGNLFASLGTYIDYYGAYSEEDRKEIISHYLSTYIGYTAPLQWVGAMNEKQMKEFYKLSK